MESATIKIGKRGTLVIPSQIRKSYGLEDGDLLSVEGRQEGILLRPVVTLPVEKYSPEDKARFLLANILFFPAYGSPAFERLWEEAGCGSALP